jgi:hypothetical protein
MYIHTYIHKIHRSQNADQVEAALFAVADVATRATDLKGELCGDVSDVLLGIDESYAIHNFSARRHQGAYMNRVACSC